MLVLAQDIICFTHFNIPIIRKWLVCVSVKWPGHPFFSQWGIVLDPHHEKTGILPMYTKTKADIICAVTAQLISVFVFTSRIV